MSTSFFSTLLECAFAIILNVYCSGEKKTSTLNKEEVAKPKSIWTTEWSADGQYFALGGDDSTVWVYDATNYSVRKAYKLNSMVRGLSWHPKENLLAIATMRGVQRLDLNKDQLITIPAIERGGPGIRWNASGELLALADGAGIVQIMNKQGILIRSISKHNRNSYLSIDWHPSKDIIVTASDEIILFNTSGKQLQFIKHQKENAGILTVRWHPSGEFFASGDYGHQREGIPTLLQFWKEDGTLIKRIEGHQEEIRNLRWSRKWKFLGNGSRGASHME